MSAYHVHIDKVPVTEGGPEREGWISMQVQWILGQARSGAGKIVFGRTLLPPAPVTSGAAIPTPRSSSASSKAGASASRTATKSPSTPATSGSSPPTTGTASAMTRTATSSCSGAGPARPCVKGIITHRTGPRAPATQRSGSQRWTCAGAPLPGSP